MQRGMRRIARVERLLSAGKIFSLDFQGKENKPSFLFLFSNEKEKNIHFKLKVMSTRYKRALAGDLLI